MTIKVERNPVKVSVIMVAYNVERYIDEAIQSVLEQRGVPFELLIGVDPGTDGTWTRIQAYRSDPRVRIWRFRRHRCIGAVRNHLIAHARGRYLSICDPDDVMLPSNLRTLARVLDPDRRVGIACGDILVTVAKRGRGRMRKEVELLGPEKGWDLVTGILGFRHGSLMRRRLVLRVGGYREGLLPAEDYDLLLRLAEVTRFAALRGRPLYCWRRRWTSVTHTTSRAKTRAVLKAIHRAAILRRYGYRVPW